MKLGELLIEGGNAIKGSRPVSQAEGNRVINQMTRFLFDSIPGIEVVAVGSAGRKPDGTSGDVDLAVKLPQKVTPEILTTMLKKHFSEVRHMPGINTISLAFKLKADEFAQVDLMIVPDVEYAAWSLIPSHGDLAKGLKAAHKNELLYAIAKYADYNEHETGRTRHWFDLTRGILKGDQLKKGEDTWETVGEKEVISTSPKKIVKMLFGDSFDYLKLRSFDDILNAIMSPNFKYHKHVHDILKMAAEGIKNKKLEVPQSLRNQLSEN